MSHKIANVLAALPNRRNGAPRRARRDLENAEDPDPRSPLTRPFAADYRAKWAKAVAKITDDLDVLLAF